MQKCAKCKSDANGAIFVEGGTAYPFCKQCSDILETFPVPTNIMHVYLKPEDQISQISKNIWEARKRRQCKAALHDTDL